MDTNQKNNHIHIIIHESKHGVDVLHFKSEKNAQIVYQRMKVNYDDEYFDIVDYLTPSPIDDDPTFDPQKYEWE